VFGGPRVPAEQSTTGKVERGIKFLRQAIAELEKQEQGEPVAWMKEGWGPDCGPYIEFYRDDEMGWRDRKEWTPLYTTPQPAQKQEQGEPLIWSTTQGGAYVCGEYQVVQRIDDKGWNAHKEHEHLLLGASLEDCKAICERDAVESLAKQEQGEPVATIRITQEGSTRTIDNHFADCVRDWPDGEYTLYTTPQPAQKPLTDEGIGAILEDVNAYGTRLYTFARAIEAAHGIKE
jgi:hypothetical protein